jgi:uncharacterized membrane protein YfcA
LWALDDVAILFGVGAVGGLLAGLLGIGGGLIYILAFTYYLNQYELSSAELVRFIVSNSIFAVFFAGLSGTARQVFLKNFYFRETIITAIPGILGALLFSIIIVSADWYTQEKFSLLVLAMLALLGYRMFKRSRATSQQADIVMDDLPAKNYAISGLFSGILSAVSGFGGGIVLIPVLSGFMRLNIRIAASISLGIMPFYTLAMSIFYGLRNGASPIDVPGTFGYIVLPMALPLAVGVVICTPAGVWLAQRVSRPVLQLLFALLIVAVSIQLLVEHFFSAF